MMRSNNDKNFPPRTVTLKDMKIHVRNKIGDKVEEDCSCDSSNMLGPME